MFRGVKEGQIIFRAPLTIIVGPNCSGKTTVLEALSLLSGKDPVCGTLTFYDVLSMLHSTVEAYGCAHLIHNYVIGSEAIVSYKIGEAWTSIAMKISRIHSGEYVVLFGTAHNCTSLNECIKRACQSFHDWVSAVKHHGKRIDWNFATIVFFRHELVRNAYPYIHSRWIDVVNRGISAKTAELLSEIVGEEYIDLTAEPFLESRATLYACRKDRVRVRLGDLGDGAQVAAVVKILAELAAIDSEKEKPKIMLWDDIEAHMNPRALTTVAQLLTDLVDNGWQVVVTTHSLEAVSILSVTAEDLRILKLSLREGKLVSREFAPDEVDELKKLGIDVRQ